MPPNGPRQSGEHRYPSGEFMDPNALPNILRSIETRLIAVEAFNAEQREHRSDLSERISELLGQVTKRIEGHDLELAEFRKAVSQVAHVLQGAFGSTGLVQQVTGLQASVSGMHQTISALKAKIGEIEGTGAHTRSGRLRSITRDREVEPPPTPVVVPESGEWKNKVIEGLIKVIITLAGLLGAAYAGAKFGGGDDKEPVQATAPKGP